MIWVMPAYSRWNAGALAADAPYDESGEALAFPNVGTGVDCTIKQLPNKWLRQQALLAKSNGTPVSLMAPKKQLDVSRLKALGWGANPSGSGTADGFEDFKQAEAAQLSRRRQSFPPR